MATNTGTAVGYTYRNIASQATNQLRTGSGILHTITINGATTGAVITVYDATGSDTTPIIATITVTDTTPHTLVYDAAYSTGLKVVTSTQDSNITISFI